MEFYLLCAIAIAFCIVERKITDLETWENNS
jgi:hypothetical protein